MIFSFLQIQFAGKFDWFGSGGSGSTLSAICFMNLNNMNEKVFLVLWALLALLIAASGEQFTFDSFESHFYNSCLHV